MAIVKVKVPYVKGLSKENIDLEGTIVEQGYVIKTDYNKEGKIFYIEINDGKYTCKHVYSGKIKLNREIPYCYTVKNGEVWSVIKIVNGRIVNRSLHIPLTIQKVKISNKVVLPNIDFPNCKMININNDKAVNASVYFTGYLGIHSITAIWKNPYGQVYAVEEKSVILDKLQIQYAYMRFHLGFNTKPNISEGIWSVDLYIDGKCLATEAFEIYSGVYGNHPIIDCYM